MSLGNLMARNMKLSKKQMIILTLSILTWRAQTTLARSWGIGLTLLDINGLSIRKLMDQSNYADLNIGWYSHKDELNIVISAHYNWVSHGYFAIDQAYFDAHLGVGIKVPGHGEHAELRTPFGVSYNFGSSKEVQVYGSIIPGMTVYPSTATRLSLALGGLLFF